MDAKTQLSEFLNWLMDKRRELADDYYSQPLEGQKIYHRMLVTVQAEIITTEQLLETI